MNARVFQLFILFSSVFFRTVCADPEARQLVKKSLDALRLSGSSANSTLTSIDAKGRRQVKKSRQISGLFQKGEVEKRLIRFFSPAEIRGTALLIFDAKKGPNQIWIYLPATGRTRKIVGDEKSGRFLGSEFSYSDIVAPDFDDYEFELLSTEVLGTENCNRVLMKAKNENAVEENGFATKIFWIAENNGVLRRSVALGEDSDSLKIMTLDLAVAVKGFPGKFRIKKMEVHNLDNNRKSILEVSDFQPEKNPSEKNFTTRSLQRF